MPTDIKVNDSIKYTDHSGLSYEDFLKLGADLSKDVYDDDRPERYGYVEVEKYRDVKWGVYVNPATHHGFVAYKGTNTMKEWKEENSKIAIDAMEFAPEFNRAVDEFKLVQTEMPGYTFDATGHSLGGAKALYVAANVDDSPHAVVFNPGMGIGGDITSKLKQSVFGTKYLRHPPTDNYVIVRNSDDYVSMLYPREAHTVTYKNQKKTGIAGVFSLGFGPLEQHQIDQFTTSASQDGSYDLRQWTVFDIVRDPKKIKTADGFKALIDVIQKYNRWNFTENRIAGVLEPDLLKTTIRDLFPGESDDVVAQLAQSTEKSLQAASDYVKKYPKRALRYATDYAKAKLRSDPRFNYASDRHWEEFYENIQQGRPEANELLSNYNQDSIDDIEFGEEEFPLWDEDAEYGWGDEFKNEDVVLDEPQPAQPKLPAERRAHDRYMEDMMREERGLKPKMGSNATYEDYLRAEQAADQDAAGAGDGAVLAEKTKAEQIFGDSDYEFALQQAQNSRRMNDLDGARRWSKLADNIKNNNINPLEEGVGIEDVGVVADDVLGEAVGAVGADVVADAGVEIGAGVIEGSAAVADAGFGLADVGAAGLAGIEAIENIGAMGVAGAEALQAGTVGLIGAETTSTAIAAASAASGALGAVGFLTLPVIGSYMLQGYMAAKDHDEREDHTGLGKYMRILTERPAENTGLDKIRNVLDKEAVASEWTGLTPDHMTDDQWGYAMREVFVQKMPFVVAQQHQVGDHMETIDVQNPVFTDREDYQRYLDAYDASRDPETNEPSPYVTFNVIGRAWQRDKFDPHKAYLNGDKKGRLPHNNDVFPDGIFDTHSVSGHNTELIGKSLAHALTLMDRQKNANDLDGKHTYEKDSERMLHAEMDKHVGKWTQWLPFDMLEPKNYISDETRDFHHDAKILSAGGRWEQSQYIDDELKRDLGASVARGKYIETMGPDSDANHNLTYEAAVYGARNGFMDIGTTKAEWDQIADHEHARNLATYAVTTGIGDDAGVYFYDHATDNIYAADHFSYKQLQDKIKTGHIVPYEVLGHDRQYWDQSDTNITRDRLGGIDIDAYELHPDGWTRYLNKRKAEQDADDFAHEGYAQDVRERLTKKRKFYDASSNKVISTEGMPIDRDYNTIVGDDAPFFTSDLAPAHGAHALTKHPFVPPRNMHTHPPAISIGAGHASRPDATDDHKHMRGNDVYGTHNDHDEDTMPNADAQNFDADHHVQHAETAGEHPSQMAGAQYEQAIKRFFNGSHSTVRHMASRGMNFTEFVKQSDEAGAMAEHAADMLAV